MIIKKFKLFKTFEDIQTEIGFGTAAYYDNDSDEKFWGNLGAGILPISRTGRILIAYRSLDVNEPHTWGIFGGKLDEDCDELYNIQQHKFIL
jgi:hypothetical protein